MRKGKRRISRLQATPEQTEAPEAVKKAREMIQRRFSEPGLTVSGIAEAVGMSDPAAVSPAGAGERMTDA